MSRAGATQNFAAAERLTEAPIPAHRGAEDEYLYVDESAARSERLFYWIEELEAGIGTGVHGPFSLP